MCKNVEAVLAEGTTMDPKCEVVMDGAREVSNDFVCVLSKENGDAAFFYNTDAITLGLTMKMVAKAFVESMARLSDEEQDMVTSVLGGDFVPDVVEVAEYE